MVTASHVLTRFSVNDRKDLYPSDETPCRASAGVLRQELDEVIAAGCMDIHFDEPMWAEALQQSEWAADILNELIEIAACNRSHRAARLWPRSTRHHPSQAGNPRQGLPHALIAPRAHAARDPKPRRRR